MSLYAQKQGCAALTRLAYEPLIDITHLQEQFYCHLGYVLVLANEPWLYGIQAGLSVFWIGLDELFEFLVVLVEESIEQFDALEGLIYTLDYDVGQVLVLICEQTQYLLD